MFLFFLNVCYYIIYETGVIRFKIEYYDSLKQDWIEDANAPEDLGFVPPRDKVTTPKDDNKPFIPQGTELSTCMFH
jgi:hypothetical protein